MIEQGVYNIMLVETNHIIPSQRIVLSVGINHSGHLRNCIFAVLTIFNLKERLAIAECSTQGCWLPCHASPHARGHFAGPRYRNPVTIKEASFCLLSSFRPDSNTLQWSKIKQRKGAEDAKKSILYGKAARVSLLLASRFSSQAERALLASWK